MQSNFTDQAIKGLSAPIGTAVSHWDTGTKGLGIRVSPKGLKTFFVLIGSGRRQTLGHYPTLRLADARTEAKKILAEKTLGSIRPTHTAWDDVVQDFLEDTAATAKIRTVSDYKRYYDRHFPFGRRSVAALTNRDILSGLKGLPPSQKHHAYTAVRALFNYCLRTGLIEKNPLEKITVPQQGKPRERVLTTQELARVFTCAYSGSSPFHGIVALLVLTGQRRGEIAALERAWLHGDTLTLPSHLTKNSREHKFPLSPMGLTVLGRQKNNSSYFFPAQKDRTKDKPATIFNGWGKPKEAFDRECGVSDWTLHDLRRTFASGLAAHTPLPVIEKHLNHVSGSFAGIVGVYQRYDYLPEMRAAVAKWESHLLALIKD